MTQSGESTGRIVAAGLALVCGYWVAAYSSRAQIALIRAPAVFGEITPEAGARIEVAALPMEGSASSSFALAPPLAVGRGPLRGGALGELAARGGMQLASLEWAPVPALPKPFSAAETGEPLVLIAPLTEKDLKQRTGSTMPVLETLAEHMGIDGLSAQLLEDARLFAGKRKRSLPPRPPMSRSQQLLEPISHFGDALAAPPDAEEVATPEFILPFASGRVTSLFNDGRRHPAMDLAGKLGSPVLATTARQRVVFAGWRGGYGNAVITQDVYGRTHLYGHLQSITSRVGQMLDQGEKLGHLGSTGHSTGPHVHYEVRNSKGEHINPMLLLFPNRSVRKGYAWTDPRQDGTARVVARLH